MPVLSCSDTKMRAVVTVRRRVAGASVFSFMKNNRIAAGSWQGRVLLLTPGSSVLTPGKQETPRSFAQALVHHDLHKVFPVRDPSRELTPFKAPPCSSILQKTPPQNFLPEASHKDKRRSTNKMPPTYRILESSSNTYPGSRRMGGCKTAQLSLVKCQRLPTSDRWA
ncbi:hypothetical protein TNCV_2539401 [Trichonephila clavipes]|nr:hypothetical protein TNCV_2539401 [Trichonephila clavipes]